MSKELAVNDNYHTNLVYRKKDTEDWINHYNNYNWPSEKQLPSFSNLKIVNYLKSEHIICHQSLYQHVLDVSGRPNYKTIEGLVFLHDHTSIGGSSIIYNGYKFKVSGTCGVIILYNWIRVLGSNINSHLLATLVGQGNSLYDHSFEFCYSRIQKELNETKENITSALKKLGKLNLITVKRRGDDDLIITLNKSNIAKISPKDSDTEEVLNSINSYYSLALSRDEEEEIKYESI